METLRLPIFGAGLVERCAWMLAEFSTSLDGKASLEDSRKSLGFLSHCLCV
jgi:hypothetical protein